MPARNTSATYAEYVSVSAVPPSHTGSTVTPWSRSAGTPRTTIMRLMMSGRPRKKSV